MKCEECEILISAYADGELSDTDRIEMEAHINYCGCCHQLYEDTIRLQRDITAALREPVDTPDLVSSFTAHIRHRSRAKLTWAWAAAFALLIISGYVIFKPAPEVKPVPVVVTTQHQPKHIVEHMHPQPPKAVLVINTPKRVNIHPAPQQTVSNGAPPKMHPAVQPQHSSSDVPTETNEAEIVVEYTDTASAVGHAADLSEPIPVAGPSRQVIAGIKTTIINGKKTEWMCYQVVDTNDKQTSTQGEPNERL